MRIISLLALLAAAWAPTYSADRTIVVIGDSLSSGYGLNGDRSWVDMLEDQLGGQAYGYSIVNASIAGDTSAGGRARLPRLLEIHQPAIVIIELGGNDGLRGQPIPRLRENLAHMIEVSRNAGAEVLLAGIRIPPNYGPSYTESLAALYPALAEEHSIPLVPFLMDGVALDPTLMQADGIHPNGAGQQPLFDNVWSVLADML